MFHLCFPVHYLPLCNASISCKEVEVKREKKKNLVEKLEIIFKLLFCHLLID